MNHRTQKIELVYMPCGLATMPSLALGQIQKQLLQAGFAVESRYFNLSFAEQISIQHYLNISNQLATDYQFGEWLFSDQPIDEASLCYHHQKHFSQVSSKMTSVDDLMQFRTEQVPAFLSACVDRLFENGAPGVVAFSLMFYQTQASLRLAERIKQRDPTTQIIFGGPSVHDVMGEELFAQYPCIDVLATGEVDLDLVEIFGDMLALGHRLTKRWPGILSRNDLRIAGQSNAPVPTDSKGLDQLPIPHFDNYFSHLQRTGWLTQYPGVKQQIAVPFETSRGCWWGEKSHCTFCGLNASGMSHRAKSAEGALQLISGLQQQWPGFMLFATDNILPHQYYQTVLPTLAEQPDNNAGIFYEIKTNLREEHVALLAKAGIRKVQPGIESLSTGLLGLMKKGVTGLQNVYALRLFEEFNINPIWIILYGFPGEKPEHFQEMAATITKISHIPPPLGLMAPMELHRFSPYFMQHEEYSHKITPKTWYRELFAQTQCDLDALAYYFDADWKDDGLDSSHYFTVITALQQWIIKWRDNTHPPQLTWQLNANNPDYLLINDSRQYNEVKQYALDGPESEVIRRAARPVSWQSLQEALMSQFSMDCTQIQTMKQGLIEQAICVEEGDKILSLCMPATRVAEKQNLPLAYRSQLYGMLYQRLEKLATKHGN